jgi:hypothetical protein
MMWPVAWVSSHPPAEASNERQRGLLYSWEAGRLTA